MSSIRVTRKKQKKVVEEAPKKAPKTTSKPKKTREPAKKKVFKTVK